jgi:hypothetical protein
MDIINNNNEINIQGSDEEWSWNLDDESGTGVNDDGFLNNGTLDDGSVEEPLEDENPLDFTVESDLEIDDIDQSNEPKEPVNYSKEDEIEDGLEDEEISEESEQVISISRNKLVLLVQLIKNTNENISRINEIISPIIEDHDIDRIAIGQVADGREDLFSSGEINVKVIEGVYDGENMIGPDGKKYSMPVNYASKSKLVEGDIMKLTILANGTFVYKQIAPMDRARVVAQLKKSGESFVAVSGDNQWRLLTASVTYYRGQEGDEVTLLIPAFGGSTWAAVDNIMRK